MKVVVTGASGFVGGHACADLARAGHEVTALSRLAPSAPAGAGRFITADLHDAGALTTAMAGAEAVVHLAGKAHAEDANSASASTLDDYRRVNVSASQTVARSAAAAGVRRIVFTSSIKVNGNVTKPGCPFRPGDPPRPSDAYGISKLEAERALGEISAAAGVDLIIIRPVLVYGPGVKGNFRTMMRWVQRGVPLPLAAVRNLRSLVAVDNLTSLIEATLRCPTVPERELLVSDGDDVSTPQLLRGLAEALNVRARLFPLPAPVLRAGAAALAKSGAVSRLLDSLQVDISETRAHLRWIPPIAMRDALARTAAAFRAADAPQSLHAENQ